MRRRDMPELSARQKSAINAWRGRPATRPNRPFAILYETDDGTVRLFGYVEHPHGGVWLRIARILSWVKNPRVVPV
jgi:hypothetical protein